MENDVRINARGLSAPGPRLMTEALLARGRPETLRVVVSTRGAADDVRAYLETAGAEVEIDGVGEEFHVLARFAHP
jgi:TusA-related sulfurtransferase